MDRILLHSNQTNLKGNIKLPSSKSESNRALMIKALSSKGITIHNLSKAEDTQILNKCLRYIETCGVSGIPMIVDAKNAGTVYRFLTAYLAIRPGKWMLTGSSRMKERPVKPLVEALRQLDADITYLEKDGYPPLLIKGKKITGGSVKLDSGISSQYISALLLVAPLLSNGIELQLEGKSISRPYIQMTIEILQYFGINIEQNEQRISVKQQNFSAGKFTVSPDWSAASYWFEMVALSREADLFINGLKKESLQGDRILAEIFETLGVKSTFKEEGLHLTKQKVKTSYFTYDFIDCPDLAQTVISTCVGLGFEGEFRGLKSLKIKETDRIKSLSNEIEAFGYSIVEENKELWKLKRHKDIAKLPENIVIRTYDDHRMAMSLAPLVLKTKQLIIEDPEVVKKSYPNFWDDLKFFGINIQKK